jgi:competence protein ComEC
VRFVLSTLALAAACSKPPSNAEASPPTAPVPQAPVAPAPSAGACGSGRSLTVHFYDVGQGLAVLVDLPDGRHVLVDTGDSPRREGCGDVCPRAAQHLLDSLRADLRGAPIDMMWITHQHSDHIGGAPEILASLPVGLYVDNGRDPRKGEVRRAREAAAARGASVQVVDPEHTASPLPSSTAATLTPIVPAAWPRSCREDENECSIALRIDACGSSVLLTGDAEHQEEALLDPRGPVTLLQLAHHGSDTSTSPAFLSRARPQYAVVSAGKPDEGLNHDYCHPRAIVVRRLVQVLGGSPTGSLAAFDGDRCDRATPADWVHVPTSDRLWATERDGDVVLTTAGGGVFRRQ